MGNTIEKDQIQNLSWRSKVANNYAWWKANGERLVANIGDNYSGNKKDSRIIDLFNIYNSIFPKEWFKHVTDPLKTDKDTNYPAKIRALNILRPNIDALTGIFGKHIFDYEVAVKGENGYNSFMEAKGIEIYNNLAQQFVNTLNEIQAAEEAAGNPGQQTGVPSKPMPSLEEAMAEFSNSFKNSIAVQAGADLDLVMYEQKVLEKMNDNLQAYLIAGEAVSYTGIQRDSVVYEIVPSYDIFYTKSSTTKYLKDASSVVRRLRMTYADIVDRFYDSLSKEDLETIFKNGNASQGGFYNYLNGRGKSNSSEYYVYHYTWKSLEKVGILTYIDPLTGEVQTDIVNETYKVQDELNESIQWETVTRWYEGYRITKDIHVEMGPVRYNPSYMNDLSKSSGPYNGIVYSEYAGNSTSILELGVQFQILYIIIWWSLEKTVAKSRGKILLLDKNVVPKKGGWTEEKFFRMAEELGYVLIDRSAEGVDPTFNQYTVLDLSQYEHINQLMQLLDFCKTQYDEQLGLSPQIKAQIDQQSQAGTTRLAIQQSSIVVDSIFKKFNEFVKSDVERLLDATQMANLFGKRSSYVNSDGKTQLIEVLPEEYSYADLGIIVTDNPKDKEALERIRSYTQALAQNGASPSMIVEIETASSTAKLKNILKEFEAIRKKEAQAAAENEQEFQKELKNIDKEMAGYNHMLGLETINEEADRRDQTVLIQGDINMALQVATTEELKGLSAKTTVLMDYKKSVETLTKETLKESPKEKRKATTKQNKK